MKTAEKIGQEINKLIRAHVGEYIHTLLPNDHDDELSFDSDDISLARSCFDLSRRDWGDFKRILIDMAIESSLLMVLMNLVYDLIDKRFVVKRFDQVLSEICTFLSRKLIMLTDRIQATQDELKNFENIEKETKLSNQQTTIRELEQEINASIRTKEQLQEDCIARESEVEEIVFSIGNEICQKISQRFSGKPNIKSPGMLDKIKRLLSKPEQLSLYKELDKILANEVNSYLTNTMLCTPTIETLLTNQFDSIKHNVLLQVDRASMTINCLREANSNISLADRVDLLDTGSKEATENFHAFLMDNARQNIKLIAINARAHLNNVHQMIISMLDKEILHLQNRLHIKRMANQQEQVPIHKPIDVLQIILDKSSREFNQLQKLYSAIMSVSVQNTIKTNKISQLIQTRTTLSKPERDYVDKMMKFYFDDGFDNMANENENVTLLDTYLSAEALVKYITSQYAKLFTIISVKDYFQYKPDRVIIRHRRALSVFVHSYQKMVSQITIDGTQFHTEKDLEEFLSSIDCKILCESSKLEKQKEKESAGIALSAPSVPKVLTRPVSTRFEKLDHSESKLDKEPKANGKDKLQDSSDGGATVSKSNRPPSMRIEIKLDHSVNKDKEQKSPRHQRGAESSESKESSKNE